MLLRSPASAASSPCSPPQGNTKLGLGLSPPSGRHGSVHIFNPASDSASSSLFVSIPTSHIQSLLLPHLSTSFTSTFNSSSSSSTTPATSSQFPHPEIHTRRIRLYTRSSNKYLARHNTPPEPTPVACQLPPAIAYVHKYIPNVLLGDGQPKTHEIEARLPAEWIRKNIGRLSKDQREIFLHETQAERLTVIEANMDVFRTTGEKSLLKLYKEGGFPEIPLDDDVERVALERMELEVLLARKPFQKRLDNLLLTNHK
ncbi:hypothetical protein F5880DRAFT_1614750 [Lentinula raphanica]|nr:hypothetical protein F5880DRAFT_1614750 [Lentinula raphanica]